MRMELVIRNVADAVVLPPAEHGKFKIMAVPDIAHFLRAARETAYYLVYVTALFTGMRLSELLGLHWVDLKNNLTLISVAQKLYKRRGICQFEEPKSKYSRRSIAVPPVLTELFRRHRPQQEAERALLGTELKEEDLVFARYDGSALDPGTVYHTFRDILEGAGIPHIRFHDLRHTHASLLLQAGIHPKIVQERLGHSSITVTIDIYSHLVPGLQEMAAKRIEVAIGDDAFKELGVTSGTGIVSANVGKMLANFDKTEDSESEPRRTRTSNRLIKRLRKFVLSLFNK